MNLKKCYLFVKNFPFAYVIFFSSLFLVIIYATTQTHRKVESHYELSNLKAKESKLNQLTTTELNEIRLLLVSRIVVFSNQLKKFKINKSNSSIDVDDVPRGILAISRTIKKWRNLNDNYSLTVDLSELNVNYLDRIILEDATTDKQSSSVSILMKLKRIQFRGKFSLCLKNSTFSCLDGNFEQLANETLVNWSAKLTLHDQLKIILDNVDLKNHLDQTKLITQIHLNSVQTSNQFIDKVILEFLKPYLNREFSKLINLEIGQTISSIYADLFDIKKIQKNEIVDKENLLKEEFMNDDESFEKFLDKSKNPQQDSNQTTTYMIRNLINLPSMISSAMYKFLEQNLQPKKESAKINFYNQDIEAILNTNLSTLQAFKTKYLTTLKDHFENVNLDPNSEQNLNSFTQPFLELIENQLRETIETKFDGFADAISEGEFDHHETESVDHDEIIPENDEITDEYTQSIRSQRTKRQVPCEPGKELDEYVDSLLKFATTRSLPNMEPIALPNATIDLPEYNMKLFLHHGEATRTYTLHRKKAPWSYCTNSSVSLGLTLYRTIKDWGLLWDGELEAKLEHTKLQVQFTEMRPNEDDSTVMQRIDRIRIWRLGYVRVLVKGLGNFTQAVSMLLTRVLNKNMDQLTSILNRMEPQLVNFANDMQMKWFNACSFV